MSPVPVFFEEGYYEYNPGFLGNKNTPLSLRTQEWWAALSGATAGQIYGNERVYPFWAGMDQVVALDPEARTVLADLFGYNGCLRAEVLDSPIGIGKVV